MYNQQQNKHIMKTFHHGTQIFFLSSLLVLVMFSSNPVLTIGMFLVVIHFINQLNAIKSWLKSIRYLLFLSLLIVVINVLFVNAGVTVLYKSPELPLIGTVKIALEPIVYSLMMVIKLISIVSIFYIGNETMDSDQAIKLFSKFGRKPVLMIILSIRLYPLMKSDYERISEIQYLRGLDINEGSIIKKIKKRIPLINTTLLSSLERAFEIAESMHARGYGIGKGTVYSKSIKRPRDYMILVSTLCALCVLVGIYLLDVSDYQYYPKLKMIPTSSWFFMVIVALMLFPAFLDWGMKKWQKLRLKI